MSELPNNLDRHIYERLLWQRILVLGDEIKDENANALCAQLILLNAEAVRTAARADHDAPADGRDGRYGERHQGAGRTGDQGA